MIVLEGRDLGFSYHETTAPSWERPEERPLFSGLSFQLHAGECLALTGPSGAGKSTLCQLLAGIIPRTRPLGRRWGQALLLGEEVSTLPLAQVASQLGMVFQDADSQLFSPLVEDELAFGPENLCLPRPEIEARISQALELTRMTCFRQARIDALSGGQRQLIALAAVLACRPRVLLLDEAFAMLDWETVTHLRGVLRQLLDEGTAVLMVEHEAERLDIADTVYQLQEDGLRRWEGSPND